MSKNSPIQPIEENPPPSGIERFWWIYLLRGVFALFVGISLILQPDKTRFTMIQYIGMYLLSSGILSLLWGFSGKKRWGMWLLAGIIGVAGGLAYILRPLFDDFMSVDALSILFGFIMLFTGLVHIFGGFRKSTHYDRGWSWGSFLLGVIEVVFGVMVLASSFFPITIITTLASVWGIAAGVGLTSESIRLWKQARVRVQ